MITTDTVTNLMEIGSRAPFDRLTETELLLVASHIHRKSYAPGEVMLPGGLVAERLVVVTRGDAMTGDTPAPQIFDAPSALFGLPVSDDYVAGPNGAEALCLSKPHLFTIARECPDFIVGLAAGAGGASQ